MSFWSFITGTTPQAEQQAQLDAKKAAYEAALQRRIDEGSISPEQAAADQQYVTGIVLEDTDAGARAGFNEGLQEGFQNVLQAPGKAVGFAGSSAGTILGGILKNIPWWVWVGAVAYLFFALGGLGLVRRRLAQ